jgi:hypothetical protein
VTAAPIRQIVVLIGVKEQAALYPIRHALLAFALGMTVLIAEITQMKITNAAIIVFMFIFVFSPPLVFL